MQRLYSFLGLLAFLVAVPAVSAQSFTAPLAGANEVDPVETDASGTAVAVIGADGRTVTVTGGFSGLEGDYAASHLHEGAAGANGPVFQPLSPAVSGDKRAGTFSGTYTLAPERIAALRAGNVYVNVHSSAHGGGEVRGQLRVAESFGTALRGANEVPSPVMTDAGGRATALLNGTTVVVTGSFSGLDSDYRASHLHRGAADANGPVFQGLNPTVSEDMRSGTFRAEDNTYTLRQSLADSLRAGLVYVNVHTANNPGGAIRGQLQATETYTARLASENEVPPVDAPGTGSATAELSGTDLVVTGSFSGLSSDYRASHLHRGAADENGPVFQPLDPTLGDDMRSGTFEASRNTYTLRQSLADSLRAGLVYVNVHSADNPGGVVRGQLRVRGVGEVVVNEVDADTPGADAAEFVELYNPTDAAVDLAGSSLVLFNGAADGNAAYRAVDLTGTITPGGYYVVCGSTDNVANCDLAVSNGFVQNGPDAVALYASAAAGFSSGTAPSRGRLVDAVVYGTGTDDEDLLDALGESAQANENLGGAAATESIQRSPDGSERFTTAAPTPGAANTGATSSEDVPDASALTLRVATPLRGATTVRFDVGGAVDARLEVFDLLGRRLAVLVDGLVAAGPQQATFDASGLPSGTYLLRLTGGASSVTRTVTVVR